MRRWRADPDATAAQWQELTALEGGDGDSGGVQRLWLASRHPLLLGARVGADRIVVWNLDT